MATAQEVTTEVQDRLLETIRVGQQGVVEFLRSWSETVEATFSKLPDVTVTGQGFKPSEGLETAFGFTEKLIAQQRDFANQVFEATIPATRAAPRTAQAARSAASASKS